MTGYYDLVLGLIPVSFIGITALLVALGFALTTAIPVASLAGFGLIGHALFVNAPVDAPKGQDVTEPTQSRTDGSFSAD